jgi:hypothetical protein
MSSSLFSREQEGNSARPGSAIDFAAVLDAGDFDGIAEVVEAGAVVADAEAELGRFDVLEALHVAFAGVDELGQGVENAQGGGLVDGAELGLGLVSPDDLFGHGY